MSSFRPLGAPTPSAPASRDASQSPPKRSADEAELSSRACYDSLTKRHAPGLFRAAALRPQLAHADAAFVFVPTPRSVDGESHDAPAPGIVVAPPYPFFPSDPFEAPPAPAPAPAPQQQQQQQQQQQALQTALTRREQRYFSNGLGASTPARRLESCLMWAMRSSGGDLALNALQNALLALGERDGLAFESAPLKEALRIITLSRSVFGEVIESAARCAWHSALRIDFSATETTPDAVWARRDAIAAATQSIRAAVPHAERAAIAKKFLTAAAQPVPPLDALNAFLSRHEAFGMSLGDFAAFTLGPRSETWLQSAQWECLLALADTIVQLDAPHQALLQGLLKLRRSDLTQVTRLLANVCAGTDGPTQKAIQLAFFTAIAKLGYGAALSCRTLSLDKLSAPLRLAMITAVGRFTDADLALFVCRTLRPALHAFVKRECIHDFVHFICQQAGPPLQGREEMLRNLQTYSLAPKWAASVVQLQKAGLEASQVMDLAAAEVFLGGQVTGEHIAFTTADTSWQTRIGNAGALLAASKQWGLLGNGAWLDARAGSTILAMNGQAVAWIRQATGAPYLRIALAQALGHVPAIQMQTCIDDVTQLYRILGPSPLAAVKLADKTVAVAQMGAARTARALAAAFLAVPNSPHLPNTDMVAELALDLTHDAHPLVADLRAFGSYNDDQAADLAVAHNVARYYLNHRGPVDTSTHRLRRLVQGCAPWTTDAYPVRSIPILLEAELRVGEGLPRFWERARAHHLHEAAVWLITGTLARLPADGVQARICLAAFQSDAALAQFAEARTLEARRALLRQLARAAYQRLGNTENVHNAVRMRATETAVAFLRGQAPGAHLDAPTKLREMNAYIDDLSANRPADSVWFRVRTVQARTYLDNARYVLTGPYHPSGPGQTRDFSRSVAETPAYMDVCALVWRAIDLYKHPSGTALATAQEQTLMREAMILGLAECVKDETGYRVCPVGFKQRIIGILQGDDRYPQVLVDAVNAAQLLTVVGQEFAHALEERDPTQQQVAAFVARARATAQERFADEPGELNKFNTDLAAWVAFEYPPQAGSQPS